MIDSGLREVLDLAVRWVHVVASILWVGNSMLWNWIDRNLEKPDDPKAIGKIWLLHSGAFYEMEKTLNVDADVARRSHWFKWQAYTTWLTGALLLIIVYYAAGGALMVTDDSALSGTGAIAVGAALVLAIWPIYDLIWRSPVARGAAASVLLATALLLGLSYGLLQLFSGRAAFLHVGAMLATIMAGNVRMRIMPAQRQMTAAVMSGGVADRVLSERAKARSIHNNYLTYPVVVLMVSSHFPGIYGHRYAWIMLGIIVLAGAMARYFMNIRFTEPRWKYGLGATIVAGMGALYVLSASGSPVQTAEDAEAASFAEVRHVIDRRCGSCHSSAPSDDVFRSAPLGVKFDSPAEIQRYAPRIFERAVKNRTMPLANKTRMSEREREIIRQWVEGGANLE